MVGKAGWIQAGDLVLGDRLRTPSGQDVAVLGVQRGVGRAAVYTLTVAKDHTFFAGSAKVLVHNAVGCSSRVLGARLAKLLGYRPADSAAHHIVPDGDSRAAFAQSVLSRFGITDLNQVVNGVFLPIKRSVAAATGKAFHPSINTGAYYVELNRRLAAATSRSDVILILRGVAVDLLNDTYPY